MNSSSSDRRSEGFFTGKGFYIVLFLCAAVIGVSAWVMATGNEAMKKSELSDLIDGSHRVETVIAPAANEWIDETELAPPEIRSETPAEPAVEEPGETVPASASAPVVYANLDAETAVKAGEWVDAGVELGTVGASALCEIGQPSHLHFEMRLNGALVDPAAYLSA